MQLSILIPVLSPRDDNSYRELRSIIERQGYDGKYQIIPYQDNGENPIGYKRNILLERATGDYVCFIDADDMVSKDFLSRVFRAIETNPDCCSLMGVITWDGTNPELFEHSIKYKEWKTNGPQSGVKYERPPNHLNVIRASIAKQFKFPEIYHGEDQDWCMQIQRSGLLKTEAEISGVIYEYKYKTRK